jgi:hypothetical protein
VVFQFPPFDITIMFTGIPPPPPPHSRSSVLFYNVRDFTVSRLNVRQQLEPHFSLDREVSFNDTREPNPLWQAS